MITSDSTLNRTRQKRSGKLVVVALIPIALLAVATIVFRFSRIDLDVAGLFFEERYQTWPMWGTPICRLGFNLLPIPGLLMAIVAGIIAASPVIARKTKIPQHAGLYVFLVALIGPGLLVNCAFKPLLSRPRPLNVQEFNGREQFRPVFTTHIETAGRSFPSGHASMGFLFMAPGFLLIKRRKAIAIGFFAMGIAMGGLLGLVRMAEGGHFISDVVWSGGMVYMTCLVVLVALNGSLAESREREDRLHSKLLEASNERWHRIEDDDEFSGRRAA